MTAMPAVMKQPAGPAVTAGATLTMQVRPDGSPAVFPGPVKPDSIVTTPTSTETIVNETFEGAFPNSSWAVYGSPTWDDTSYAAHGGSWSAWCGATTLDPAGGYTDNMNAWMVYGPFSLADATDAALTFWFRNYSESGYDWFACMASINGTNFYGWSISGNQSTWQTNGLDFKNIYTLGNLCGQPQVWIAFIFQSDDTVSGPAYTGTYVDDVLVTKTTGPSQPNLTPFAPSGWSNPIVVSKEAGTYSDDSPLLQSDTIYVDWAVINSGTAATAARFYTRLLLDGVEKAAWYVDPPLDPNWYVHVDDYSLGQFSPGDHTIRIETDSTGVIAETSETDNVYQRTFNIQAQSSEIRGSKWNDLDGDGTWDAGEPGLANWQIFIDQDFDGQYDSGEPSQMTGPGGSYAFTGLAAGTYVLCEVPQLNWVQKYPSLEAEAPAPAPSTIGDLLSPEELAGIGILVQDSPPTPPLGRTRVSVVGEFPTSAVLLDGVPTSTWTYGCSATSAGMMFGYYDRHGYPNMYTGPANGGICPLTNLGQGIGSPIPGSCSIIATEAGFDGRVARGHVDDYWIDYGMPGPDPWEGFWTEHAWGGCTADYMGTNQWKYDYSSWPDPDGMRDANSDGGTILVYNTDGSKLYDFIPPANLGVPPTECCHGLRLFAESRGYTVIENYTQQTGAGGFTFANYQAEIDAGRPVMIQVVGHTMVGVGYDAAMQTVYLHDTWDNSVHSMPWGGSYEGMAMQAVTVLRLVSALPPGSHSVTVAPGQIVSNIHFGNKAHLVADANDDGCVDVVDLLILVYSFGKNPGDPGYDPTADFNHDGPVDVVDLLELVGQFGMCL
jgi:hypothetical protein